jgi:hypothetical protein
VGSTKHALEIMGLRTTRVGGGASGNAFDAAPFKELRPKRLAFFVSRGHWILQSKSI